MPGGLRVVLRVCSVNCADGDYPMMYTRIAGQMSYTGFGGDTSTLNAFQKVRTR